MITISRGTNTPDNILEYKVIDKNQPAFSEEDKNAGLVLSSNKAKWIWPFKSNIINFNLKVSFPDNTFGLITEFENNRKIDVISRIIHYDYVSGFFVKVRTVGILPRRINKEELIARLTVVPYVECHLVNLDS